MPPTILCSKDRQKIQDTKKIQDTNDMVGNRDTGGIAKRDIMQMIRKVRRNDLKKEGKSKDTREISVFLKSNSLKSSLLNINLGLQSLNWLLN